MRLVDYDKLQLKLRNYADKKADNGEIEIANGILKAKCFIDQECEIINKKQLNGGWISVKVRLPNEDGYYLTTWEGYHSIEPVTRFHRFSCGRFELDGIIAWQALPEPYKEVE